MDFQKSKIYLDKLNREFARMSKDPENIVRLDVDIMASYIRELYDAILSDSAAPDTHKAEPAPMRHPHRPSVAEPLVEIAPAPPPQPMVAAIPPPAAPPPMREEPPAPAAPPPPPPQVFEEPKHAPRHTAHLSAGLDALFEEKQAKELSEKLADSPIVDLKKAIALNDRLLYTSELFGGDGKAFEAALASLGSFTHFDEARDYLVQHCAAHFAWTDKKRLDTAKAFVKLVRRRYK